MSCRVAGVFKVALAGLFVLLAQTVGVATAEIQQQCGGRAATHVGTPGDDLIEGSWGHDVIVGLDGLEIHFDVIAQGSKIKK